MLPFYYAFLTLVLSSSLVAVRGNPYHQPVGESKPLIGNQDLRLEETYWTQVEISEQGTAASAATWPKDEERITRLDNVIRFEHGNLGIEKVHLSHIERKWKPKKRGMQIKSYRVLRSHYRNPRPAEITPSKPVDIMSCRSNLDDTYWGLNPKILGTQKSGKEEDRGYIIHIKWEKDPTKHMEVPHVTFESQDRLKGEVLMAEESYEFRAVKETQSCEEDKAVRQTQGEEEVKVMTQAQSDNSEEAARHSWIATNAGMSLPEYCAALKQQKIFENHKDAWKGPH